MIVQNIADYVAQNAVRIGERAALIEGPRTVSYAGLYDSVLRHARFLQDNGVKRGDIVGLSIRDGIDHVAAMLGIIRLGAVLLPMDSRWTSTEKENVLRAFGGSFAVTDRPDTCEVTAATVITHDLAMISATSPDPVLPKDFTADDPLLISLSSGTTGLPKGPRITHRQMIMRNYTEWLSIGFHSSDVFLCATPQYFGGGRGFTLSYLYAGGTVVFCPPPYKSEDVSALIRQHGVTTTFLVPTLLRRLAQAPDEVLADLRGLRFIISSGAALHPAERRDLLTRMNSNLVNFYASTEGGGVSALMGQDSDEVALSVGRPLLGSHVRITDNDGNVLPPGETGHIQHRAAWHPDGFYRNPEETSRYFRDGWYMPGDMGHLNEDGYLFITGRSKDMIIRGGINIYPNEIEAVLISHEAVADAAVVGIPSEEFGEDIKAFVVCKGNTPSAQELIDFCRNHLAPYKVPRLIDTLPELPRNSGGKVLKNELLKL